MCYCPTPTLHLNLPLTGDGAFIFSLKKTHSVWFISILNYGDTENVLINHLLLVIPMSYPCHYTNLCHHKPQTCPHTHKHTHTHTTHTHTHTHTLTDTHTHTHTLTDTTPHTHIWKQICFDTSNGHFIVSSSKKNINFRNNSIFQYNSKPHIWEQNRFRLVLFPRTITMLNNT